MKELTVFPIYNIDISALRTLDTVPLKSVLKSELYFLSREKSL